MWFLSARTLNLFLAVCAQRTLAVQEGTGSRSKSLLPSHRHGKAWDSWLLGPLGGEDGSGISLSPASFQLIPSFKLVLCWEIISCACNFAGWAVLIPDKKKTLELTLSSFPPELGAEHAPVGIGAVLSWAICRDQWAQAPGLWWLPGGKGPPAEPELGCWHRWGKKVWGTCFVEWRLILFPCESRME